MRRRPAARRGRRRRCARGRPRSAGAGRPGDRRRRADARRPGRRGRSTALRRARAGAAASTRWSASRATAWSSSSAASSDPLGRRRAWPTASAAARWSSGPTVPHLYAAGRSARAALAGLVAARAWPEAPRPVLADDLLPERVLTGDAAGPPRAGGPDLPPAGRGGRRRCSTRSRPTSSPAARSRPRPGRLFVHPNTVRYRLRRIAEITGYDPSDPREGFVLQHRRSPLGRLATTPPRPPGRTLQASCRKPLYRSRQSSSASRHRLDARRTEGLVACSSSSALVRAPRPPASSLPGSSCPASQSGCAGCPPSPGSTWSPTAPTSDAETIRDTAVAQPLIVASGPGQPAGPVRASGRGRSARSAPAPATRVGEITAAAAAGVMSAEQAMVFVRERGNAMAAASAVTPTGMSAVVGGDPDEVRGQHRAARPDRGQRQQRRAGRRRRHAGPARRPRRRPARPRPG